jgi:methionine aminopeptidase
VNFLPTRPQATNQPTEPTNRTNRTNRQGIADKARMSIVQELVGHGIGRVFHAAPAVLHHRSVAPCVMGRDGGARRPAAAALRPYLRRYHKHPLLTAKHTIPLFGFNRRNQRPGVMQRGQTFTIEPILTLGSRHHRCWSDGWTLVTADGSLAAQFEHTLLITDGGAEVMTRVGGAGS